MVEPSDPDLERKLEDLSVLKIIKIRVLVQLFFYNS